MRSLSQNERELPKCGKLATKEGEGSDLSLSGSQVSLASRPRSVMGKASIRALSVSGPRVRRPMSAVPTMSFTEISRDKRRPYSADSQLLLTSYQQKRNRLSACFSTSADPMSPVHHDTETDGDIEFSSSTLVSSQLSDQLGSAWIELEMRGLYLGQSAGPHNSSSTDNGSDLLCCSEVSEEHARSEKSLGERIQAMARDHIQYDCLPHSLMKCPEKKSYDEDDRKLEKYMCDSDPKKMSTKELHFRMVESGLIAASSQHDVSKFRSQYSCHSDINPEVLALQQKADLQGINDKELGLLKDTASSKFWNQHFDFFQTVSKSDSINQISFPKEHDVDSLEGDSGLDSQRREIGSSPSLPLHLVHENGNNIQWHKSDLGPVRFQQWVDDSSKSNGVVENGGSVSSTYFCNVRSSHLQSDKKSVDLDCTVEEVSTDSEYSKLYGSPTHKTERGPYHSDYCGVPSVSKFESDSTVTDEKRPSDTETQMMSSERGCFDKVDHTSVEIKGKTMSGTSKASEPNKLGTDYSNKMENSEIWPCVPEHLPKKQIENLKGDENNERKSSAGFKEDLDKKVTSVSKPISPKGKKLNDTKKDLLTQVGTKRKTEGKLNGSSRRCGKTPSSHHTFSQPKEETLPGEAQPELLSWMAMFSDDLGDQTKPVGGQMLKDVCQERKCTSELLRASSESKDQDSPYNEIMTILRVLEDKEDESSLMRILNKRCELRTPDSNPMPSSDGNSTPSLLLANQNEPESSRLLLESPEIMDASNRATSELSSVAKFDSFHNVPKSTAVPCASEIGVPQSSAQGELRDLLTFLDAVDQSCSSVLQPKRVCSSRASPRPASTSEVPHNLEELLLMGRSELAQEVVSLRLALEDRAATINLLRTALREQKDSQERQNTAHKSELENQMRQVKAECEAVIKRHQKFIDQLIADKASLSKHCESLVQDAKECEEKHAKSLKNLEEKHKVETQRIKDITAATEKLKRERWVDNKTQKIKELTVRGLEPELTRLTSQHEQEMSALRTLHAQELEQMEVRAARRASQQMETLREQLVQEKEDALAREREMLRQRMEKQQLLFEEEGAEQRRRLVAEVRREQDRLATLESRLEVQFEERKRALEREAEQERERMRRDYSDKLNEIHRKQQNEILQYREALEAEKESWTDTYQQQQKQALIQTTNEIRDQLKRERDREIEVVIERLESEATISREEREKTAENRLRRVREQLTSELRDVEAALNTLKEKHAELRAQLQEKEDKLVSLEALNRSLHTQLVETRKIADQLSAERADLKQTLQSEVSNDMEGIRQQLSHQHTRHQQQLQILAEQSERERQTHQKELQQLYDRVKLAITKKEEVVKVAKAKQKAAEEQNSHLQALLDHRRKESLLS